MATTDTKSKPTDISPSISVLFGGCFCFYLLASLFFGVFAFVIWASIVHPKTFGIFVALPYFSWTLLLSNASFNGSWQWPWFSKNFICFKIMRQFLQLKLKNTPPPEIAKRQCIYAVFPHGVYVDYRVVLDGMLLQNGISVNTLAASVLFRIPVVREFSLWTGCIDARKSVARRLLAETNHSMMVLPGGEAEQIRTEFGKERIYLKRRRGFLKLALEYNIPVIPVYVFGCSDSYWTNTTFLYDVRMWLVKTLAICIPLAWGWGPFCPRPISTTVVFGEPLEFQENKKIDDAKQLEKAHNEFIASLEKLFDENKEECGYGDRKLEIL